MAQGEKDEAVQLYQLLFENARDGIMLLELAPGGPPILRDANPAALEMHGYTRGEVIGKSIGILDPDADAAPMVMERGRRVRGAGGGVLVVRHRRKDGSTLVVETSVKEVTVGGRRLGICVERDITERQRAEEELRASEARNLSLIKAIPDMIFTNRRDGEFLFVHALDQGLLFLPPAAFLHKKIGGVLPPPVAELLMKGIAEALDSNTVLTFNYSLPIDGRESYFEVRMAPCIDDTTISIVRDITERKLADEALKKTCAELEAGKKRLADKNVAFQEVISEIEAEKSRIKNDISANINEIVMPIVLKIKRRGGVSRDYAVLLENSLRSLVSSFGRNLTEKKLNLTPKEIEICNMIKSGLTTKEIAGLSNSSPQTVNKHRNHIRKKLGLTKKGKNLTSFLQSL